MAFVLVPVPSEHVLEVMRWVLFRSVEEEEARASDAAKVAELLATADELTRKLLDAVAKAALKDEARRFRDVVDELGADQAASQALVDTLNQELLDDGREVFETWVEVAVGLEGRRGSLVHISMRKDLAKVVRSITRPGGG